MTTLSSMKRNTIIAASSLLLAIQSPAVIAAVPSSAPSYPDYNEMFFQFLGSENVKNGLERTVFQAHNAPDGIPYPTTRYSYEGLISSLQEMAIDGITSDGRSFVFYTGQDVRRIEYGLANLAAFLANAMVESLGYDTCDEFNTDTDIFYFDRYPLSNSCGQNLRSYQDEVCTTKSTSSSTAATTTDTKSAAGAFVETSKGDMSCYVDTGMEVESMGFSSEIKGVSTPPPFTCRPKSNATDYAGYWDAKTGETHATEYSNSMNRTDVEGCCWWGRGVLLTRGVCNIGKLNYYLGKRASVERGEGRFPNTDFCSFPEAICSNGKGSESTEDIKWIVGMFEWIERIQSYKEWDYMINLQNFVDGGSWDDSFIDAVSSIFTQGCQSSYCSTTTETKTLEERRQNFGKVLEIFKYSEPSPSPMAATNNAVMPTLPTTEIAPSPSPMAATTNAVMPTQPTTEAAYTPSISIPQMWEFDPTIPTTQQWNGNAPIDLTPTWALEYYGNPPAQIIPTLDGYNPTTQEWNANPPAQLASLWEGSAPSQPTSQQGNGNSFPTAQQGNVPSVPTVQGWNGNSPTMFAPRPEGSDPVTPSSQLTSDATNPTTTASSQGGGTSTKGTLIPMEDSSARHLSPSACCLMLLLFVYWIS